MPGPPYAYDDTIPLAGHSPAFDQPLIQANFAYLSGQGVSTGLNRDHVFSALSSNTNDLTHKQVTFNDKLATPGFAGGSSVLYTKQIGTPLQSEAFFNNASIDLQLTGKFSTYAVVTATENRGSTFLPGGLVLNYGNGQVSANGSLIFVYATAFSAPAYSITIGGENGTPGVAAAGAIDSSSTASFRFRNTTTILSTFRYMAIGPA